MKRNALIAVGLLVSVGLSSCIGLPDRLIYRTGEKTLDNKDQEQTASEPTVVAETAPPVVTARNRSDTLVFGEEQSAPPPSPSAPSTVAPSRAPVAPAKKSGSRYEERIEDGWVYRDDDPNFVPHPVPRRLAKPREPIQADQRSDLGHNALSRVFEVGFEQGWEKVLETMIQYPLLNVDKSSGIIITEWVIDRNYSKEQLAGINIFGGVRLSRFKYIVRLYRVEEGTEVTVVPFAQVTKNSRWHDGKATPVVAEKLMKKIIKKLGG